MTQQTRAGQCRRGRCAKIKTDKGEDLDRQVHDAIARRAYQICAARGREPGHEMEDWRRAESEVLRPLCCGYILSSDRIKLVADGSCFEEGEIEIHVEPRRLTLRAKACAPRPERMHLVTPPELAGQVIFRACDFPAEIDPCGVTARFKGPILEIDMPMVRAKQREFVEAKAA